MKTLLIDRWENSIGFSLRERFLGIYLNYLSFVGFVSVILTQYFVACDLGLKPKRTKCKIGFLMSLFFQEFLLGRNVGTHKMG